MMDEDLIVLESMDAASEFIATEGIKDKLKKYGEKADDLVVKALTLPFDALVWGYKNTPKARAERKEKEELELKRKAEMDKMPTVTFEEFKSKYYPKYKACIKEMNIAFKTLHNSNKISEHSKLLRWFPHIEFSEVDEDGKYPWPPHVEFMEYKYPSDLDDDELTDIILSGDKCALIDKLIKIANKHAMDIDYYHTDGVPYEWYIVINDDSHNFSTIDNDKLKTLKF